MTLTTLVPPLQEPVRKIGQEQESGAGRMRGRGALAVKPDDDDIITALERQIYALQALS